MAENNLRKNRSLFPVLKKDKNTDVDPDEVSKIVAAPVQKSPDDPVGFEEELSDQNPDYQNETGTQDSELGTDLVVLLSRLKLRIDNLEKNKFEMNRSFSEMNKLIGELRSRIFEQEKYIDVLESKANIANDLVRTIDPIKLGKDFEEQKAKLDAVDAKIESFISLSDSIKSEVSNVDSKISAIGTPDEIKVMNKDMQNMLKGLIERESRLSARLERSENLFYDMQKNYTESLRFFSTVDAINSSMKSIISEYQKMDIALRNYVPSDLFSRRISEIDHFLKSIESRYLEILKNSGLRESALSGESIVISDSVKNIKATEEVESLVNEMERKERSSLERFGRKERPTNTSKSSTVASPSSSPSPSSSQPLSSKKSASSTDDEIIFSRSY